MKKLYALFIVALAGLAGCKRWNGSAAKGDKPVKTQVDAGVCVDDTRKEDYLVDDIMTSVDADRDDFGLDFDMPDAELGMHAERELIPVYFDYGKTTFAGRDDQKQVCQREAREAKTMYDRAREEGRELKFVVEGLSCDLGKAKENYKVKVGERRARAVAKELEAVGIPKSAIEVRSLGTSASKLADGTDDVMHALNRRAEIKAVEV